MSTTIMSRTDIGLGESKQSNRCISVKALKLVEQICMVGKRVFGSVFKTMRSLKKWTDNHEMIFDRQLFLWIMNFRILDAPFCTRLSQKILDITNCVLGVCQKFLLTNTDT